MNAAGSASVTGIAGLQVSGQITQLGLQAVIEQSAPQILALAGKNFAGPLAWGKFIWDAGQFSYETFKCSAH